MTAVRYDFTSYAPTYEHRADYAPQVIDAVLRVVAARAGDPVCDIGAGSGHLTIPLLEHGLRVDAVEPNAAMREVGERRTARFDAVSWFDGQGERSGRPADEYTVVTFGSSFDRTDQPLALREAARILRPGGYFVCGWNHRVLDDPLQREVEALIHDRIPGYQYGLRRTDPTGVIRDSGLFEDVVHLSGQVVHEIDTDSWCAAWRSHMTLGSQAGDRFDEIVTEIERLVTARAGARVRVPYVTPIWLARLGEGAGHGR
jgi:ubiquinone/menaquinone biosynthesis C-methylase UbiE